MEKGEYKVALEPRSSINFWLNLILNEQKYEKKVNGLTMQMAIQQWRVMVFNGVIMTAGILTVIINALLRNILKMIKNRIPMTWGLRIVKKYLQLYEKSTKIAAQSSRHTPYATSFVSVI